MEFRALAIIVTAAVVAAVVLYLPFHLLGRWMRRRVPPRSGYRWRITRTGGLVYGLQVTLLLLGFAQMHLAPASFLGDFVSHWLGFTTFTVLLVLLFILIERLLARAGAYCVVPYALPASCAAEPDQSPP